MLIDVAPGMQRSFRFTLGERIQNTAVDLLQNIYRANSMHDKLPYIQQARDNLISIRLFLRLAHDKKQISAKLYLQTNDLIESAGKQLTSWGKSVMNNTNKGFQPLVNEKQPTSGF
jgi:hypothetical protein